jgi:hypothetical protein
MNLHQTLIVFRDAKAKKKGTLFYAAAHVTPNLGCFTL